MYGLAAAKYPKRSCPAVHSFLRFLTVTCNDQVSFRGLAKCRSRAPQRVLTQHRTALRYTFVAKTRWVEHGLYPQSCDMCHHSNGACVSPTL